MPKIKLVFNPMSDRGRSGQRASDLRAIAEEHGGADWVGTEYPAHAIDLAAKAGLEGYDIVVAMGGDGTVHEVVNGLMRVAEPHRPKLGVVPIGSGNDFAYGSGVSLDAVQAMQKIFTGTPRPIDIGVARDNNHRTEYWDNSIGIGFDAKINIMSRKISGMYGFPMYLTAVLRCIFQDYESAQMKLCYDEGPVLDRNILMLTLGNGPREGGGFMTTPASKVDDGVLDYVSVPHMGRLSLLALLPRVMNGTHGSDKRLTISTFKKLRLEADRALPIHADGELWSPYEVNTRTVEIEIMPAAMQLLT